MCREKQSQPLDRRSGRDSGVTRDPCHGPPSRFFDLASAVVDVAWALAVGSDFGVPETRGERPRGTALFDWYLGRLVRRAHADGVLTDAFVRVLSMERPPTSLLRPRVAWRVLGPTG